MWTHDLAVAVRRLCKAPGFSVAVILTLALGIGATTALFTVAETLLLRPLPLPRANEIVVPLAHTNNGQYFLCSLAELERWRAGNHSFSSMGAAIAQTFVLTRRDAPELLRAARTDADYFATLGITPRIGRLFDAKDGTAVENTPVAVLGYDVWKNKFGGDAAVLGQPVHLDDRAYTIVGVLPPGVDLPSGTQVYVPLDPATVERTRHTHQMWVVGRLKPDRSLDQADAELKALCAQLALENPAQHRNWTALALPLRNHLFEDNERTLQKRMALLGGAVGLLILIACANAANLVLARALNRERELATRVALGASPWSNVRLVLAENALLAVLGGGLGLLIAVVFTPVLFAVSPVKALALANVVAQPRLDWRVLAVTAGLAMAITPLFSLPAVLRAVRIDPWRTMQDGPRGHGGAGAGARWRELILAFTVALSLALLTGAGVVWRSYLRVRQEPLGFDPRAIVSVRIGLTGTNYQTPENRWIYISKILDEVRAIPGVKQAGITNRIPLHIEGWSESPVTETGPLSTRDDVQLAAYRLVSAGYLEALGAELRAGRFINDDDRATTQRVVVINQRFAELAWPGENPIGKRVRRKNRPADEWLTVVGVIANIKEQYIGGLRASFPAWYLPYQQSVSRSAVHIVARAGNNSASLARSIEEIVHRFDAGQAVYEAGPLEAHVRNSTAQEQFGPYLLGSFAILGLLLAAIGIYGLTDYLVQRRVTEIGVRLALGATPASIYRMMLKRSLVLFSLGAVAGIGLAYLLTRLLSGLLHKVSVTDPVAFGSGVIVLGAVVFMATTLPARRAAKTDPIVTLRSE